MTSDSVKMTILPLPLAPLDDKAQRLEQRAELAVLCTQPPGALDEAFDAGQLCRISAGLGAAPWSCSGAGSSEPASSSSRSASSVSVSSSFAPAAGVRSSMRRRRFATPCRLAASAAFDDAMRR